jgi:signal transduction histidine kinase
MTSARLVATRVVADSPPPSDGLVRLATKLSAVNLSATSAMLLSGMVVAAATYGDAVTQIATTFTLFYVVALLLAVWFAGIRAGYLVSLAAVAGNTYATAIATPPVTIWFLVWNAGVDLVLYLLCGHLFSALHQRLQAEAGARQDALGQLRHAQRLTTLGRLASGIAHEIGTPLNVISGRAELIAAGTLRPEAMVGSANIIIDQTERVSSIIRQLLDFGRRGGTRVELSELSALVEETAILLRPLASKTGVAIACSGVSVWANVNRSELQQVFTNLLTNAMHAMPHGGTIEVRVASELAQDPRVTRASARRYAVVRVEDQGSGIAPAVLPRIFEPFFTTRDVGVGTGLGLSVAYGIVQDHGGWLEVDTELGRGTAVSVYLPQ